LHSPINTVLNKLQKSTKKPEHPLPKSQPVPVHHNPLAKSSYVGHNSIQHEIDRLSSIITKLEGSKISINFNEQLRVDKSPEAGNVIFSRDIHVLEDHIEDFIDATKEYLLATKQEADCLYTYVKRAGQKDQYVLYSVWVSTEKLSSHFLQPHYRKHIKTIIDYEVEPERINKMIIPSSWVQKSPI